MVDAKLDMQGRSKTKAQIFSDVTAMPSDVTANSNMNQEKKALTYRRFEARK